MDCVVSPPGDQTFPLADDDERITLSPVQKVVGPLAVIVGVAHVRLRAHPQLR